MATDNAELTPQEAVAVLRDLNGYEEQLSNRTNGITLMVWGLVSAAIFLTYGTADPYLEEIGKEWIFALLWIPWIAAGMIASRSLWSNHALSLRRRDEDGKQDFAAMGGSVIVFFAICFALFAGLDWFGDFNWTISSIMTIANGLFAVALSTILAKWFAGCRDMPTLGAGIVMVVIGIGLGAGGIHYQAATLLGAAATGASWFAAGIINYRRG